MTHPLRRLIEAVTTLNRNIDLDRRPPDRPIPRGEGQGPKGGLFWIRGSTVVPIVGRCNEIVSLCGQTVMVNPDKFGLTSDNIMAMLAPHGTDSYSPQSEYRKFLDNPDVDLSHMAYLWKSSKIVYEAMLKAGWAWVKYTPPESIHFAMIQEAVKRQIAFAGEYFPLMQIDRILITVITRFDGLLDRFPQMSKNRTLVFNHDEFKGFAGSFGGALDWSSGSEAPASNFLYFVIGRPQEGLHSSQMSVRTEKGYRKRWGIRFFVEPVTPPTGASLGRVPISLVHSIRYRKHWDAGISPVNAKGMVTMYSDQYYRFNPSDIEIKTGTGWQSGN